MAVKECALIGAIQEAVEKRIKNTPKAYAVVYTNVTNNGFETQEVILSATHDIVAELSQTIDEVFYEANIDFRTKTTLAKDDESEWILFVGQ